MERDQREGSTERWMRGVEERGREGGPTFALGHCMILEGRLKPCGLITVHARGRIG